MNETIATILKRRSVRAYRPNPVKQPELNLIRRATRNAFTAMNQQPWHFTVIRNPKLLEEQCITAFIESNNKALRELANMAGFSVFYHAPMLVIISGDPEALAPQTDCTLAMETLMIAATSLGIGSRWTNAIMMYYATDKGKAAFDELGVTFPEDYQLYAAAAFGYPAEERPEPPPKGSVMKKNIISAALAFVLLLCHSMSYAALKDFTGKWQNTDPNTRGITTLIITGNANNLKMHAWGNCHPNDCDWGTVNAYAYTPSVSSPVEPNTRAVSAVYTTSFSQTLVIVKQAGRNMIRAEVFTRFTDNSNRSNYTAVYAFKRQLQVAPIKPIPMTPRPAIKEDCLSFNPATTTLRNIDGRWTIVDGNHWLFNFGDKKAEALQALKIIKHYKMNQSCFVGRPDPSFSYLLVNGKAPQGGMAGEDCIGFNPNTIAVKKINGRWKIVDGNHWMFDFGNKKNEARKAFAIIKKYGFDHSCYVGRPNASFMYLKK